MARNWTDPRDGTAWLIEALPFDAGPNWTAERPSLIGWTIVFVSHFQHRSVPVGDELGASLGNLEDKLLMGLLDAAGTE
jgi:hypothetical protein